MKVISARIRHDLSGTPAEVEVQADDGRIVFMLIDIEDKALQVAKHHFASPRHKELQGA